VIKHALTITHVGIFFTQRSENVRRNTLQRERGVAIRAATRRLQLKLRNLSSTLANFVGDLTRIRRRDDRQAGAAPTGWAARAMHIFQAGARRPLYPSWAAMITSADGPSRASPDFPHIPVPLGCNKTPLGRTLLRRVPRQAPPKLAKVELRNCTQIKSLKNQYLRFAGADGRRPRY